MSNFSFIKIKFEFSFSYLLSFYILLVNICGVFLGKKAVCEFGVLGPFGVEGTI